MAITMNSVRTFTGYFPLWGVSFDSEECGLMGGRVLVCKPYEEEWRKILKSDVLIEFSKYHQQNITGIEPQPCLCLTYPLYDDISFGMSKHAEAHNIPVVDTEQALPDQGELPAAIEQQLNDINIQISDAIITLRLLKSGWFHDPRLIEYSFMSSDDFSQVLRVPGPYRQLFMAGFDERFPTFYQLSISDLSKTRDDQSPLSEIWNLIQRYRQSGGNMAVEIAIQNFNNAYSLVGNVSYEQKIAFLFTSLDAVMGGMSLRKKGNKYFLNKTEMTLLFKDRIYEVLKNANIPFAENEARWLDSIRSVRNPIAHGAKESMEKVAEENFERLLALIRIILKRYISFSTRWNTDRQRIAQLSGLEENTSLVEAFNKVLENSFLGSTEAGLLLV